jgi:hypothetical protein
MRTIPTKVNNGTSHQSLPDTNIMSVNIRHLKQWVNKTDNFTSLQKVDKNKYFIFKLESQKF